MLRRRRILGGSAHVGAETYRPDLAAEYVRWTWSRAFLHRGWWLVTSVYLVVDARLSPSELVLIGAAQGAVGLVFEIPAGVVADTISRKWSLVLAHVLMGTAMVATGLVTGFGAIVATQVLWGLSWTFISGADVAWITDELDEPARVAAVLVRAARAELTGAALGLAIVGAFGSLTERSTAIVVAGAGMLALGAYVIARFPEERFVAMPARRWSASWAILAGGSRLVRGSRALVVVLAATFLVNGAAVGFGRLQPRRLVDIGLPLDPVAWLAGLGVLTLIVGTAVLRFVEPRVDRPGTALRGYAAACGAGASGALGLAAAGDAATGSAAVLVVAGIALPLTRTLGTIWVNRQATSEVRATVHSFVAQAEYAGELVCGLSIAAVAGSVALPLVLVLCAVLFVFALLLVRRLY